MAELTSIFVPLPHLFTTYHTNLSLQSRTTFFYPIIFDTNFLAGGVAAAASDDTIHYRPPLSATASTYRQPTIGQSTIRIIIAMTSTADFQPVCIGPAERRSEQRAHC